MSATASTPASLATIPCYIAALPNELKDNIFGFLGWELSVFLFNHATHDSALKALWPFFCTEKHPQPGGTDAADLTRMSFRYMAKARRLVSALEKVPSLAPKLTELTLAIPNVRVEVSPSQKNEAQYHSPTAWDCGHLHDLFKALSDLEKLTLTTFVIPRSQNTAISWHYDPSNSSDRILIPPSVKHLIVEETPDSGCASAETRAMWTRIFGRTSDSHETSRTLRFIRLCPALETLHVKTFRLERHFIFVLMDCQDLKELRYDVMETNPASSPCWSISIGSFFSNLKNFNNLTVLDLRFCRINGHYGYGVWPLRWAKRIPQVRTMRVAFHGFAEILQGTDCEDNIHFELLFDYDQAVRECTSIVLKTFEAKSKVARSLSEKMDLTTEYERDFLRRIHHLKHAIKTVQQLGQMYDARSKEGLGEKRSVSIVECEWAEMRIGSVWFEQLHDGREYCRLIEKAIGA